MDLEENKRWWISVARRYARQKAHTQRVHLRPLVARLRQSDSPAYVVAGADQYLGWLDVYKLQHRLFLQAAGRAAGIQEAIDALRS